LELPHDLVVANNGPAMICGKKVTNSGYNDSIDEGVRLVVVLAGGVSFCTGRINDQGNDWCADAEYAGKVASP
jgi:hypothetical protein